MIRQNLHTHTVFDDGHGTPIQMAQAALNAGLQSFGFSAHAILPYENDWCLTAEALPKYLDAVSKTKDALAGKLPIYSGLELDILSDQATDGFDYVIGSIHHICVNGETPSIDDTAAITEQTLTRYFHNNKNAMVQAFFSQYTAMAADPRIDIVGHFDIISKFDETNALFDGTTSFYRDCAMHAMEQLLSADKIFEVNTGAMYRGYRTEPYPSRFLLSELLSRGGRLILSADAHDAAGVAYGFREMEELLRSMGFRELWTLTDFGFMPTLLS